MFDPQFRIFQGIWEWENPEECRYRPLPELQSVKEIERGGEGPTVFLKGPRRRLSIVTARDPL